MKVHKVLKGILWKSVVIKVIQIIIFSQIVFAQSLSDDGFSFEDNLIDGNEGFREVKIQEIRDDGMYEFKERTEFRRELDFWPNYETKSNP